MLLGAIASSQDDDDRNFAVAVAAVVAIGKRAVADAVGMMLFQKLQQPRPQAFASFLQGAGVAESVQARSVASNSVSVGGDLVDAAAGEFETFGDQVGLEKSGRKRIDQASDAVDT